jgi:hypothetical protein
MTAWPPLHDGRPDEALEHPRLRTAEVKVAREAATLIGTYLG